MSADQPGNKKRWQEVVWQRHRYNDRTVLKSGSFLNAYCPHCGASLIREDMIHLLTLTQEGEQGWVELSPYLNVFERRSDIQLPAGMEVADLKCESCGASLKVPDRSCQLGDAHVACMMVGISNVRVPFYFCMREGCPWHLIDPEDEHRIILDESMEW